MKTIDRTVSDLCHEIDYLKKEVEYYKALYEQEKQENNRMLNENLESAKKGVANALMFALSVSDNANGDLIISRENRETLANNIKN